MSDFKKGFLKGFKDGVLLVIVIAALAFGAGFLFAEWGWV